MSDVAVSQASQARPNGNGKDLQGPRIIAAAIEYTERGYRVVRLRGKAAFIEDWPDLRMTVEDIENDFQANENVGILLGDPSNGLVDIDLDCELAIKLAGHFLPATGMKFGRKTARRSHWLYNVGDDADKHMPLKSKAFSDDPDGQMIVEYRATGVQTMVPPSKHPNTGEQVEWEHGAEDAPAKVDGKDLRQRVKLLAAACLLAKLWKKGIRHEAAMALAGTLLRAGWKVEQTERFIEIVASAAGDEEDRTAQVASTDALIKKDGKDGKHATGIVKLGKLLGEDAEPKLRKWLGLKSASADVDLPSELEMAERFAEQHGDDIKYLHARKQWLVFDESDGVWRPEKIMKAYNAANTMVRGIARDLDATPKQKRTLERESVAAAVVRATRGDTLVAVTSDQFDTNPYLFNAAGQAVNLKTGEVQAAKRSDYFMRAGTVAPNNDGCPAWLDHLQRITGDDDELIAYLRRYFGYCLTGDTSEHVMAFLYGTGKNGKSVTVETIGKIAGDYQTGAAMETLMTSRTPQHPTDLAKLVGARMVTAVETQSGRRWDESKIKAMTGGDTISARFMRGDFFDYEPQFKLVVAGNHKPRITNTDVAMRRRLHLLPFTVEIPEAIRDLHIRDKFMAEGGGILAWLIDGASEQQRNGLQPPTRVLDATKEYFEAEDIFQQWLDDCCDIGRTYEVAKTALYDSWKAFCDSANERPGNRREFADRLREHSPLDLDEGWAHERRVWRGIKVKEVANEVPH